MKIITYKKEYNTELINLFLSFVEERREDLEKKAKVLNIKAIKDRINKIIVSLSLKNKGKVLLSLNKENELIGFLIASKKEESYAYIDLDYIYIDYIYIKKEYQGLGYSSFLKREIIKYAKESNIKVIKISFSSTNKKAKEIYTKWGFKNDSITLTKKIS